MGVWGRLLLWRRTRLIGRLFMTLHPKQICTDFLDAINGICVNALGYQADKFPIEHQDDKLEHKVLSEILTCTDNPHHPQPECSFMEKVSYDFHKASRMWKNRWKYKIVYDESLLESFLWKAQSRMKLPW